MIRQIFVVSALNFKSIKLRNPPSRPQRGQRIGQHGLGRGEVVGVGTIQFVNSQVLRVAR